MSYAYRRISVFNNAMYMNNSLYYEFLNIYMASSFTILDLPRDYQYTYNGITECLKILITD